MIFLYGRCWLGAENLPVHFFSAFQSVIIMARYSLTVLSSCLEMDVTDVLVVKMVYTARQPDVVSTLYVFENDVVRTP